MRGLPNSQLDSDVEFIAPQWESCEQWFSVKNVSVSNFIMDNTVKRAGILVTTKVMYYSELLNQ